MGQKANPNSLQVGRKKLWCTLFSEKKLRDSGNFNQIFELEILNYMNRLLNNNGFCLQDYKLHYCENALKIFISIFSTEHLFNKTFTKNNLSKNKNFFLKLESIKTKKKLILNHFSYKDIYQKQAIIDILTKNISERLYNKKVIINICYVNKNLNMGYEEKGLLKKGVLSLRRFKNQLFFLESFAAASLITKEHQLSIILLQILTHYIKTMKGVKSFLKFLKKSLTFLIDNPKSTTKGIKIKIKGRLTKTGRAKSFMLIVGDVPCHSIELSLHYNSINGQNQNGSYSVKLWVVGK